MHEAEIETIFRNILILIFQSRTFRITCAAIKLVERSESIPFAGVRLILLLNDFFLYMDFSQDQVKTLFGGGAGADCWTG